MASRIKMLVLSLCLSISCIGCSLNRVILHPINKQDIVKMESDVAYTPDRSGWFLSDSYLKEVMKAKVK